jgi:hypothetical protein
MSPDELPLSQLRVEETGRYYGKPLPFLRVRSAQADAESITKFLSPYS